MSTPHRLLRLLTFTTLYPDETRPHHGVFVETRLRQLVGSGEVESLVVAPVPWFPFAHPAFGAWARFAAVARSERRHGLDVLHPRYLVLPRIGMMAAPVLLYASAHRAVARLLAQGHRFDAIDAHYLYPDGVVAVWLGRAFGLPVAVTARGSDLTQIAESPLPRRMIRTALVRADALIGVSAALAARMVALDADPAKVVSLRNGVDCALFRPPTDRLAARAQLGVTGAVLVSVGHLIERKRHDLTISALVALTDHSLLIAGDGPERSALEALARRLGVAGRVRFLGVQPPSALPAIYGAADAMVLASSREGWANVLLEAMACGTPVVASNIPGNDEVVRAPEAGVIVGENTAAGIATAVRALRARPPDRAATRAYAERHSWDATTAGQLAIFRRLAGRVKAPDRA